MSSGVRILKAGLIRGSGLALSYIMTIVVARNLGPEEFGVFITVLSASAMIGIVGAGGMPAYLTKAIAMSKDSEGTAKEIATAMSIGLGGVGCMWVFLTVVMFLGGGFGFDEAKYAVVLYSMFVVPLFIIIQIRQGAALALRGPENALLPEQIILPALFVGVAGYWSLSVSVRVRVVVAAYVICGVVALGVGVYSMTDRLTAGKIARLRLTIREVLSTGLCGLPFLTSAIGRIVLSRVDIVLVSFSQGFAVGGVYAVATRLATLVAVPQGIINLVLMPRVAELYACGRDDEVGRELRMAATLSVLSSCAVAIAISLSYDQLLELLGKEFGGSKSIWAILVGGQVVSAYFGPVAVLMQMTGLERLYSRVTGLWAASMAVLVGVSAGYNSVIVVATIVTITNTIGSIALFYVGRKYRRMVLGRYRPFSLGRSVRTGMEAVARERRQGV